MYCRHQVQQRMQWLLHDQLQSPKINFGPFELDEFVNIFVLDEPFQINMSNVDWNQPHPHIQYQTYCHQALKTFDNTLSKIFFIVINIWFIVHQLEYKSILTSNGFWNTVYEYKGWALKKFTQLMMERFYNGVWICMKPLLLLAIECAHLVKLDSEHRLYVWGLIDHFLQTLLLCSWTVMLTCGNIR